MVRVKENKIENRRLGHLYINWIINILLRKISEWHFEVVIKSNQEKTMGINPWYRGDGDAH